MKKYILFISLIMISSSILAQKQVRKHIREGNSAYEENRYSAAEEAYNEAIKASQTYSESKDRETDKNKINDKDALYNLGNAYYKQNKLDETFDTYKNYLKQETDSLKRSAAFNNLGNTYLKKESDEKNSSSGMMPQKQGKEEKPLDEAIKAYKDALRLNPNDEEARTNLAIAKRLVPENDGGGEGDGDQNQDQQNQDQNQDQNKDQNKDDKDQNKDDKDKDKDQNKDKDKDQNKGQDQGNKQDQNQEQGISKENMERILQAIEQDEKETQERVNQIKAQERKDKMQKNKELDKDW